MTSISLSGHKAYDFGWVPLHHQYREMLPLLFSQNLLTKLVYPRAAHALRNVQVKRSIDIWARCGTGNYCCVAVPLTVAMLFDNPVPLLYSHVRCGLKGRISEVEISIDGCRCRQPQHLLPTKLRVPLLRMTMTPGYPRRPFLAE